MGEKMDEIVRWKVTWSLACLEMMFGGHSEFEMRESKVVVTLKNKGCNVG